jgi:hypothetical protein
MVAQKVELNVCAGHSAQVWRFRENIVWVVQTQRGLACGLEMHERCRTPNINDTVGIAFNNDLVRVHLGRAKRDN